ncbi:hypothetical protein E3P99_01378 [Wallemia hederae]|uniref:DUF159-domain-containing protein n=1 Tax=Wallemia hederae TaxID=1540922 RepID=A0A4V4LTM0_9BASI|nr:hypothetical protein E3P99_01378 [Wallemia hederae]
MCGRFSLHVPANELGGRLYRDYGIETGNTTNLSYNTSYNVAPTTNIPVINSNLEIHVCRWGIIPHFANNSSVNYSQTLKTINARAESLEDGSSPLWNSLKSTKRCVIPVDGFFEWLLQGKEKIPHFTKRKDNHMMLFAGLHDRFQTKEQTIDSFTIITTSASKQFEAIHNRMPVILDKEGALKWLDKSKKWDTDICHLLKPYHDSLDIYAVTKEMSKPGSSKPSYIQPISDRKDGIKSFFAKQAQSPKKDGVTKHDLKKEEHDVKQEQHVAKTEDNLAKKEEDDVDTAIKRSLQDTEPEADVKPAKKVKKTDNNATLDGYVKQE